MKANAAVRKLSFDIPTDEALDTDMDVGAPRAKRRPHRFIYEYGDDEQENYCRKCKALAQCIKFNLAPMNKLIISCHTHIRYTFSAPEKERKVKRKEKVVSLTKKTVK